MKILQKIKRRERERDEGIFTVAVAAWHNSLSVSVILNHLCFAPEMKLNRIIDNYEAQSENWFASYHIMIDMMFSVLSAVVWSDIS